MRRAGSQAARKKKAGRRKQTIRMQLNLLLFRDQAFVLQDDVFVYGLVEPFSAASSMSVPGLSLSKSSFETFCGTPISSLVVSIPAFSGRVNFVSDPRCSFLFRHNVPGLQET